nr:hypothetical protein GCM10020093_008960 [Planobispora longispora]
MPRRPALSHDRIIDAAVRVADRGGLTQVSMRNVGKELGVEAMSLYHHVTGKEALLDELVNWFFTRIELPDPRQPWRRAMADRAASARTAVSEHPWALGLIESRTNSVPPCSGTTTPCSAACAATVSRSRWRRTPSPRSTPTSTASC